MNRRLWPFELSAVMTFGVLAIALIGTWWFKKEGGV